MSGLKNVLLIIAAILVGILLTISVFKLVKERESKTPVEEYIAVDSLIQVNDSIKIKVEQIDSIKDAKVIEVLSLNNDSTVKLFFELVSE